MTAIVSGALTVTLDDGTSRTLRMTPSELALVARAFGVAPKVQDDDKVTRIVYARALRQEGLTFDRIVEETGLTEWVVYGHASDIVVPCHSGRTADPKEDARVAALYERLGTYDKVARKTGYSKATVSRMVRRHRERCLEDG